MWVREPLWRHNSPDKANMLIRIVRKRSKGDIPEHGRTCYTGEMNYAVGRSVLLPWLAMLVLCGCAKELPPPSPQEVRAAQAKADYGNRWDFSSAPWAKDMQSMRDRAYLFCMEKYPDDEKCLKEQDWSLIAAHHAETTADSFIKHPDSRDPRSTGLASEPSVLNDARSYCFSVYRDAGSRDARMLGPCMQVVVGGDYFGIVPVP